MKTPTKLNKIVFIKNNTLDLIPIAKKIKAEETEKDKIIELKWQEKISLSIIKALAIGGMIASLIDTNLFGFIISFLGYSFFDCLGGLK